MRRDVADAEDSDVGLMSEAQHIRDSEAEYTLEYAAVCPSCRRTLKTVRVIRLLRTRVNFTSTVTHGLAVEMQTPGATGATLSGVWLQSGVPEIEPFSHGENVMLVPERPAPSAFTFAGG